MTKGKKRRKRKPLPGTGGAFISSGGSLNKALKDMGRFQRKKK